MKMGSPIQLIGLMCPVNLYEHLIDMRRTVMKKRGVYTQLILVLGLAFVMFPISTFAGNITRSCSAYYEINVTKINGVKNGSINYLNQLRQSASVL